MLKKLKLEGAIALAHSLGWVSRMSKRGSGVMIAGRVLLRLEPRAAAILSSQKQVVLISGTNGKTTTTSLVYQVLTLKSSTISNFTGANLFAGIAAALSYQRSSPLAALEVDEMVLPWAIIQTRPELVVLLNLGRDQLDRLSEVRAVALKWKNGLKQLPAHAFILADGDDPFVRWAAADWPNIIWFSSGNFAHLDASTCPQCGAILQWSGDGSQYFSECGFKKPISDWTLAGSQLRGPDGKQVEVKSAIPGIAALGNAARAIIVADFFEIELARAQVEVAKVSSVEGRFSCLEIGETNFRLMLSKNPASWRETLRTSATGPKAVTLVINANAQDGRDTSWLWDVDFSPLQGRTVLVTGERALDLAARLTVSEIEHRVVRDEKAAAKILGAVDADLIASYTAFHRLAKSAAKSVRTK